MRAVAPFSVPCIDPVVYESDETLWIIMNLKFFIRYNRNLSVIVIFSFLNFIYFLIIITISINHVWFYKNWESILIHLNADPQNTDDQVISYI